jgi:hypothetical protein
MEKHNVGITSFGEYFFLYKLTFFMYEVQFKINAPFRRGETCP